MGSRIGLQSQIEPDDLAFMNVNDTIKVERRVLVSALSRAVGLAGGKTDHHRERVAYIALRLGKAMNLSAGTLTDLHSAALFHDLGVSVTGGRCSAGEHDVEVIHRSAARLAKSEILNRSAQIVRHSRKPWAEPIAEKGIQSDVLVSANLIFLADRIDASIDWHRETLLSRERATAEVSDCKGTLFNPEAIRELKEKAKTETFWLDMAAHHLPAALENLIPADPVWLDSDSVESLVGIFSEIVDEKNPYTRHHSRRVSELCRLFARELGLSTLTVKKLGLAGLIHDLGKFAVPDEILAKPGALAAEEFEIIKRHPYETYYIFSKVSGFADIRDWAACHHERMDGSGYPFHYGNDHFSTEHVIVILSEILQSLIQDLPGRPALSRDQVLDILEHMTVQHPLYSSVMTVVRQNFDRVESVAGGRETAD